MNSKKRMNDKGQEGLSITTILVLILGIVVVVVIIIGVTGGFDFIFGKIKLLPGQSLQTVVESCNSAAQLKLKADYCETFKKVKIDSKSEYINCQDSRVQRNMKDEAWVTCDNTYTIRQCNVTLMNKEYNVMINGVLVENNNTAGKSADVYCTSKFP